MEAYKHYVFPPAGTACMGFDNSTLVIRFPRGAGLLVSNYTMHVDVINPKAATNATLDGVWSFETRVRNELIYKIVDANRSIGGFEMSELQLEQADSEEGGAPAAASVVAMLVVFLARW